MTSTAMMLRPRDLQFGRDFIYTTRYEETVHRKWESDAKIWVVKTSSALRRTTGRTWAIWAEPEFYESKRQYNSLILGWIEGPECRKRGDGFCEGRPMVEMCIRVPLCVGLALPWELYRVVHDEHPFSGTRARGYGRVEANPFTFQIHFQRHLHTSCRDLSPFMSATSSLDKAMRIAAKYDRLNFSGIEVLVINTTGSAWGQTFVFDVQSLIECFELKNLARNSNLEQEYLIQNEIPSSRVVRVSLYGNKSQWSTRWRTAWHDAEKWVQLNNYHRKRRFEAEGADVAPRKRQVRTHN